MRGRILALTVIALSAVSAPHVTAQGVVEFAPYVCGESYPEACADPAERRQMEANRKRSLELEKARRDAERIQRIERQKAKEQEQRAVAAGLGLSDHRLGEAQRYLDMRNAAAAARGNGAECRSAPKVLVEVSPFLGSKADAEAKLRETRPEKNCPDNAGGSRGEITCSQTLAYPHEALICGAVVASSKCSGRTLWQCKMTVRCVAPQLICPPSRASTQ